MVTAEIWCDGACEPTNPGGTGTWGFVVEHFGEVEEYAGLCGTGKSMSNNVEENTLKLLGIKLKYIWVPRDKNERADKLTKDKLAELGVETRTH